MSKRVVVIHTSFVSVDYLKGLFKEIIPEVEMINIVDDSLLAEVKANGHTTPAVVRRVCSYAREAEQLGADLIFNQCSSVGEAADVAQELVNVPYLKVDLPMAEKAVELGKKIAVVATVASTVGPSVRLVERAGVKAGKDVTVKEYLVAGALDVLMGGDPDKHNQMVLSEIERAAEECDVVVLAQGSMVVLEPMLKNIKAPVLTSPRMGVERIKEMLGL